MSESRKNTSHLKERFSRMAIFSIGSAFFAASMMPASYFIRSEATLFALLIGMVIAPASGIGACLDIIMSKGRLKGKKLCVSAITISVVLWLIAIAYVMHGRTLCIVDFAYLGPLENQ
ncbi:MAG: hypothetical protein ACYTEQ_28310 [Planctomycetota bacterium]|jgi:hypothetical protein